MRDRVSMAQAAFRPIGGLPTHLPPYSDVKCPLCLKTHQLNGQSERWPSKDCGAHYSMYHGWEVFSKKYGYIRPLANNPNLWTNDNPMSANRNNPIRIMRIKLLAFSLKKGTKNVA